MEKEKLVELVRRAQGTDPEAFSILFVQYKNTVYSIALRETKNRALAEDIVQETFVEVIQTIGNLRDPASFPGWVKQIAYHQCSRHYKRKETRHEVQAEETEDSLSVFDTLEEKNPAYLPEESLDRKELQETILTMIVELPDVQSSALRMFYYDELPLKAIAEVQGVSLNTANTRLNRGRKAVKTSIEAYEKKHGVRLHSIAFFPFFKWLLSGTQEELPAQATAKTAQAVAARTGISLTATTSAATAGAATASTSLGAKIAAAPIMTKIASGVLAAAIAVGGVVGYQAKHTPVIPETTEALHDVTTEASDSTISSVFPTEEKPSILPLVSDAYFDYLPENAYPGGESFFHIPMVNADLPQIEETNSYIYENCYNYLQTYAYDPISQGEKTSLSRFSYVWGSKDAYLSILMSIVFGEPSCGVYTISLETGALIDSKEILSAYHLTWEDFLKLVEDASKQIGDELLDPYPYINPGNGDLCAVGTSKEWGWSKLVNLTGISDPVYPWNNPESAPAKAEATEPEDTATLDKIYAKYEELLASGESQQGFVSSYYAYKDIDQDGIPELIITDSEAGPMRFGTVCEMYTYHNEKIIYCGYVVAHYDYLYYANRQYLLGQNRMGPQFLSTTPEESFQTAIYHWNEEKTRNDPAISYNGEEWEYITTEEFDFYRADSGGFVETKEIIPLQRNTFLKNPLQAALDFSKAWASYGERDCGLNMVSIAFEESGSVQYIIARRRSGTFYGYCGYYTIEEDILHFWITTESESFGISYQFDPVSFLLTQTSERGFFPDSYPGEVYRLEEDRDNDAKRTIELAKMGIGCLF